MTIKECIDKIFDWDDLLREASVHQTCFYLCKQGFKSLVLLSGYGEPVLGVFDLLLGGFSIDLPKTVPRVRKLHVWVEHNLLLNYLMYFGR
jgi:hypothetical protein